MLIYVVTRDGVVMHIATDFDEAEIAAYDYVACACNQVPEEKIVDEKDVAEVALLGWGNGVEVYEANTDDAVLDLDAGIKLTLKEIRERLGADIDNQIDSRKEEFCRKATLQPGDDIEFAESKTASGNQKNSAYSGMSPGDGFMNIPDWIDEELPFN